MKVYSSFLPILAISAKKRKKYVERSERGPFDTNGFQTSSDYRQCSDQITAKGGIFETTNDGLHGQVKLENYPNHIKCNHVIQAAESCSAIRVSYQSIAVQDRYKCKFDQFRFGWPGPNGFNVTPPRCDCFGDGCSSLTYYGNPWQDYSYDYSWTGVTGDLADTDGFSVNSNTFTFYFRSNSFFSAGHVIFDWECLDQEVTTQVPGTQGGMTTNQLDTTTWGDNPTTSTTSSPFYFPTTSTTTTTTTTTTT